MEMPECPVCLQVYDGEEVIPRVLSCGHSACSPCIAQLSSSSSSPARSFPDTIRCPACNQVVPCPRGRGPDALPKNIDLLRLCSSPPSSRRTQPRPPERTRVDFFPLPWDEQLFSTWKDWILPSDAVSLAAAATTATEAAAATLTRTPSCGPNRCFEENQPVRLLTVGASSSGCEQFKLSYTARVLGALNELGEKERAELGFIMSASSGRSRGLSRVFGLWMSPLENSPLFLVCERFQVDLSYLLKDLQEQKNGLVNADELFTFAKISTELCETVINLHSQGVACGCLALSCFCFDGYGHCLLDLSEVLIFGRGVRKDVAEARRRNHWRYLGKIQRFVSPEILTSARSDHNFSGSESGVGYGSDVWSLACILGVLLVGDGRLSGELLEGSTDDDCVELSLDSYNLWMMKLTSTLKSTLLGTKLESLLPILESCLNYDPVERPSVNDVWRCIMSLLIKPHCSIPVGSDIPVAKRELLCCLVLGDLCCLPKDGNHSLMQERNISEGTEKILDNHSILALTGSSGSDVGHLQLENADKDLVKGFYGNGLNSVSLQGHQDCVTGLAVGGGFLFSSSFDKTVHVWSLEDYSLTCTMTGHKSVVSSLAVSNGILYSGSWDGTIRLWWLHDHSPLAVLEDDKLLNGTSILSLLVHDHLLVASCDNGFLKMWRNDLLLKSVQIQNGALFAVEMDGKFLFSGGWDKIIQLQEFLEKDSQVELRPVGSISCDSVVTSLLRWEGKLFVGSNKDIKVYYSRDTG